MALVPYDPFKQLADMRKDFDRFFSNFPSVLGEEHNLGGIQIDVYETENDVVAVCDIPGLEKKENVELNIENDTLSISGTINRVSEMKEENMHRKERHAGRFHRSISLPSSISHEVVKDNKKKIEVDFQ